MKKYLRIIITSVIFLVIIRFMYLFLYKGKSVSYEIDDKFNVYENYVKNNDLKYYYFEVTIASKKFNFRAPAVFNDNSYVIKDIYYFEDDNYLCILPIFQGDSIQTDILCHDGEIIQQYRNLKNMSLKLDEFGRAMEQYGYKINSNEAIDVSNYGINLLKNINASHTLLLPSYRGLFKINKGVISSIDLFKKDVYEQNIQGVISNYYIVADYDESYSFTKFKLVDLKNGKVTTLSSKYSISMNSYVQGVVDNLLYIIDRSNRKQYTVDVFNKTVTLVGNGKKGVLNFNGTDFETKSIYSAINEDLLFSSYTSNENYDYIYLIDNIYYLYKKVDDGYAVYVSYAENKELYTYIFSVASIDRIQYIDSYVYYVSEDKLYCYHPKSGVYEILEYSELFYNSNLKFWTYKK